MKTSLSSPVSSLALAALFLFCASTPLGTPFVAVLVRADGSGGDDDCDALCEPKLERVIADCDGSKEAMVVSIDKLTGQMETVHQKLHMRTVDVDRLTAQNEEYERHEGLFKARIAELTGDLATAKQDFEAQEAVLKDMILQLQGSLAGALQSSEEASKATSALTDTVKVLEKKLATAKEEADALDGSRIRVNWDLLKADWNGLLKKLGLAKGDDEL